MKLAKPFVKLSLTFDADKIYSEIHGEWAAHFIPEFAKAGNDALLLVTTNGTQNHDHNEPMLPTQTLNEMPYTKSIWTQLGIPFERSRLMRIQPGGEMPEHSDIHPRWDDKVRLHIPIKTNDNVTFTNGGESINMKKGEAWLLDNSLLHGVKNKGEEERIHLVIDIALKDLDGYV